MRLLREGMGADPRTLPPDLALPTTTRLRRETSDLVVAPQGLRHLGRREPSAHRSPAGHRLLHEVLDGAALRAAVLQDLVNLLRVGIVGLSLLLRDKVVRVAVQAADRGLVSAALHQPRVDLGHMQRRAVETGAEEALHATLAIQTDSEEVAAHLAGFDVADRPLRDEACA